MSQTKTVQVEAPDVETKTSESKTITKWSVFEEAGFIPIQVKCDGYENFHDSSLSCKTSVVPSSKNIIGHMDPDHGGGWFKIKLGRSDVKKSPIWKELADAGVEIQDFKCPHCRQQVEVSPRRISYHLGMHPGATRVNLQPQVLCFTLSFQKPDVDEYGDLGV